MAKRSSSGRNPLVLVLRIRLIGGIDEILRRNGSIRWLLDCRPGKFACCQSTTQGICLKKYIKFRSFQRPLGNNPVSLWYRSPCLEKCQRSWEPFHSSVRLDGDTLYATLVLLFLKTFLQIHSEECPYCNYLVDSMVLNQKETEWFLGLQRWTNAFRATYAIVGAHYTEPDARGRWIQQPQQKRDFLIRNRLLTLCSSQLVTHRHKACLNNELDNGKTSQFL